MHVPIQLGGTAGFTVSADSLAVEVAEEWQLTMYYTTVNERMYERSFVPGNNFGLHECASDVKRAANRHHVQLQGSNR